MLQVVFCHSAFSFTVSLPLFGSLVDKPLFDNQNLYPKSYQVKPKITNVANLIQSLPYLEKQSDNLMITEC